MQSSDSPCSVGRRSGSPRERPTTVPTLVLSRPRMRVLTRGASEIGHRLSVSPEYPWRGGASQVSGSSSASVPWSYHTPPGCRRLAQITTTTLLPSGTTEPSTFPERCHFRAANPTARSLADLLLRPSRYGDARKVSLLACRAQLWPDGSRTRGTTNRISRRYHLLLFRRTSLAWSHPLWASDYRPATRTTAAACYSGVGEPLKCVTVHCLDSSLSTTMPWDQESKAMTSVLSPRLAMPSASRAKLWSPSRAVDSLGQRYEILIRG